MILMKQTIIRGKVNKILYNVQLLPLREAAGEAFPEFLPPFAAIQTGKNKKMRIAREGYPRCMLTCGVLISERPSLRRWAPFLL